MMRAGFLEEVAGLRALGYTDALPSMQSLGYRELTAYLEAPQGNLADAVERIKRDTRRFAKRQMTWFRRDEQTRWLDVQGCSREQIIDTMIHALGNP